MAIPFATFMPSVVSGAVAVLLLSSLGTVLCQLPASSSSTASWSNVADGIDSYPNATNLLFIVGNASGVQYTHKKGALAPTMSSMLNVASASKWVSATVIYRMIDSGVLSISDHPQKYLTWWTSDPADNRSAVTVELLLAFTSGTGADNSCLGSANYTHYSCAQQIYNQSFVYAPGTTFYYSGNHMEIVAAMAEAAAAASGWLSLFYEYVGTPLNLSANVQYKPLAHPALAGGLYISSADYVTFLQSYLSGALLSAESYANMLSDHTPSDSVVIAYSPVSANASQSWHYCQGNWFECSSGAIDPNLCSAKKAHSSAGTFGYYPRIDFANNYYSVVAREAIFLTLPAHDSVLMFYQVESNVTALMTSSAPNTATPAATSAFTTTASNSPSRSGVARMNSAASWLHSFCHCAMLGLGVGLIASFT